MSIFIINFSKHSPRLARNASVFIFSLCYFSSSLAFAGTIEDETLHHLQSISSEMDNYKTRMETRIKKSEQLVKQNSELIARTHELLSNHQIGEGVLDEEIDDIEFLFSEIDRLQHEIESN
jgi:hypothetical protein